MRIDIIINNLFECENWIFAVAGREEAEKPHIKAMLKSLASARELLYERPGHCKRCGEPVNNAEYELCQKCQTEE